MPETKASTSTHERLIWRVAEVAKIVDETPRVKSLVLDVPGCFRAIRATEAPSNLELRPDHRLRPPAWTGLSVVVVEAAREKNQAVRGLNVR